ncbi:MAG: PAS domain S-box protein [Sulfuricurvum sp.]|uniref:sensor domain-containing protein n=1 Tax=Sulfuricurvum sp. TaxID=2025608 RepID=UPI00262312DF|nr:PAS domain S-box protein [Sulfuricurvum sp.]MDD2829253.1 PAS domain S-box protein [Sulfuricurvum sp.]MDD4949983.1 PAS domain S-box protein [Sulfuricurvum sp.]
MQSKIDFTKQLQVENDLRYERGFTQNILDTVEAIIVAIEPNGKIILINRKGCELLGYSEIELIAQDWFEMCLPPTIDKNFIRQLFRKTLSGDLEESKYAENLVITRSGEERLIAWHNSTMRDVEGNIIASLSAGEDITERKKAETALEHERGFLKTLIQTIPDLIWLKNVGGVYLSCNPRFEDFFGAKEAEIVGKTDYDFVDKELADFFREHDRIAMEKQAPSMNEEWVPFSNDGHRELLETTKTPMLDSKGELLGILGIGHNITERRSAEERLELFANVFTHAREGILITNKECNILEVNDAFTRITGYSYEEVKGCNPSILKSGRQNKEFYSSLWDNLTQKGHWRGEIWNRRKNGEIYAEMQTISVVLDPHGEIQQYVALFSDITNLKENEERLERIAHYDILTGLPNRLLLADRLQQAMLHVHRRKEQLAVVYLDLDGFKDINDRYGHGVGDQFLIAISANLKHALREGDTISRIGGDEFVALLLDVKNWESSIIMLERLLDAASKPIVLGDEILKVTASLGVTFYTRKDNIDADLLLRHADEAMYQAKQSGKNQYQIYRQKVNHSSSYDVVNHVPVEN